MKLGIIRETKTPPDKRVPLTPWQCMELMEDYPELEIVVQPDNYRCFSNREYAASGIPVPEDLSGCDVLLGVKEVKTEYLIENKTYLFFSHTAKEQPYNRDLLREILKMKIRLIDYEYLTRKNNTRVVAFGRWAGIVGAYNGLRGYGLRTGAFDLKPANQYKDLEELLKELKMIEKGSMGRLRIVLTGGGRVAGGAMEILDRVGIRKVAPEQFIGKKFDSPIYTQLDPWHYTRRKDGADFSFEHFVKHPDAYENNFHPYTFQSDMFIACHFWDPKSPLLITNEMMEDPGFHICVIADISCDIDGPIASTIRASTIADPFYGYNPVTKTETDPFLKDSLTVMAVDNLPGELPRDASADFGFALMENVIPALMGEPDDGMLERATIAKDGALTQKYKYLHGYVMGKGSTK